MTLPTRPPGVARGLLAVYVRPPGSPDLAPPVCAEAPSLRCISRSEHGAMEGLDRSHGQGWLVTTPALPPPRSVPDDAFLFVSIANPLEALEASSGADNPQCAALLPLGETADLDSCAHLWEALLRRCDWVGDAREARSHRRLVEQLVARGGEAWRHARPAPAQSGAPLPPARAALEALRARHAADFALYRAARKEHAACMRGGRWVRGDDDTPPYRHIGQWPFEQVSHTARGGYRAPNASGMWSKWRNYSWVAPDCPALHAGGGWCDALRGKRVLYVGDSTQYQAFLSLLGLMHLGGEATRATRGSPSAPSSLGSLVRGELVLDWKHSQPLRPCGGADNATTINFVRNDWLVDPTWHMGCSWREQRTVTTICRYWAQHLAIEPPPAAAAPPNAAAPPDVVVLTTGAHVIRPEGRHLNHTYALAEALARTAARQIFWVHAAPGHEGCCHGAQGAPATEPLSSAYVPPRRHRHGWDAIGPRDDAVFDLFESLMPRRVQYIDGARLLNARADHHVCGAAKQDCLHYFLPGPPDVANLVLRHVLREGS